MAPARSAASGGQPGRDRPPPHPRRARRRLRGRRRLRHGRRRRARMWGRPMRRCCSRARRWPRPTSSAAALVEAAALAGRRRAASRATASCPRTPRWPRPAPRPASSGSGPPPEAMRVMGHKARAKEVVAGGRRAGAAERRRGGRAPIDASAARRRASVGYPLLVKASAGGGGRGMRLVGATRASWPTPWRRPSARPPPRSGRTRSSWSGISRPPVTSRCRCVGDSHGTVLHLLDRECSVQRRHQKVVEEAPAVLVPEATRRQMWDAAVAVARAVGYVGVGTVEYLVDASGFFFLEMNTRLQVEHGVTELVTGLDLVGLQLAVAAGQPLAAGPVRRRRRRATPWRSASAPSGRGRTTGPRRAPRRTCAGRRGRGCGPTAPSSRAAWSAPPTTRWWPSSWLMARTAPTAVARLSRALRALELDGLETNRELLGAVLDDAAFRDGRGATCTTSTIRPDLRDAALPDEARRRHAAAAAFCLTRRAGGAEPGPGPRRRLAQRRAAAARRSAHRCRGDAGGAGRRARRAGPRAGRRRVACRGHGARPDDGVVDLVAGRAAASLPGAAVGPPGRRQRARGPVELRPAHRGRRRRARRRGGRVPRPAAGRGDQGARRRG